MPYLKKFEKAHLDQLLLDVIPLTPGQLNFCITRLCQIYIRHSVKSYETLNAVMGALSCAQNEFYRRVVVPYEQAKIVENGDVY
jgi:hypothetical protein